MLFDRGGGLDAVGFMPLSEGETISFLPGMKPSVFSSYPTELAATTTSSVRTLASPTVRPSTSSNNSSTVVGAQTSAVSSISSSSSTSSSTSRAFGSPTVSMPHGLSQGAIAGISIGSCTAGILFVAAGFLFFRYRKQRRDSQQDPHKEIKANLSTSDNTSAVPGFSEADSRVSSYTEGKSELPGSPVTAPSQRESMLSQQSGPQSPSSSSKEQYYRPFRYQPADGMHGIQELSNPERPQWAQTGSGTYGPIHGHSRAGDIHNSKNNLHELPG